MRSAVLTCGTCAAILFLRGGEKDSATTKIGLGVACQCHPTGNAPQATSSVLAPEQQTESDARVWARAEIQKARAIEQEKETKPALIDSPRWQSPYPVAPALVGPLTEVSMRLLCSWTHGDGTAADELAIDNAVIVARRLLQRTQGA